MWPLLIQILFIVTLVVTISEGKCSGEYGARPCTYLPAPPGQKPPCAGPADTFCEYPTEYPMHHIRYLINKWGYDYSTLFSDESRQEYSTYFKQPDYGYTYGPVNAPKPQNTYYQEPIYIPRPAVTVPETGNKYIPPPSSAGRPNSTAGFSGYLDGRPTTNPKFAGYNLQATNNHINQLGGYHGAQGAQGVHGVHGAQPAQPAHPAQNYMAPASYSQNYYARHGNSNGSPHAFDPNNWWRISGDGNYAMNSQYRSRRSTDPPQSGVDPVKNATGEAGRAKRQNDLSSQRLCQTRSQYIMPRAAVNSKGNWMYVVNLQELDSRFTQLVKSETCATQQCSGLCGLPNGYTSRCEQKFVQKRLVALEGAGQQLYTDVFWFPSCCVCTITGGNI